MTRHDAVADEARWVNGVVRREAAHHSDPAAVRPLPRRGVGNCIVGVDIGGTNVRAGLVVDGKLQDVVRRRHRGGGAYQTAVDYEALLDLTSELVAELSLGNEVAAVGVAIAGVMTSGRRMLRSNDVLQWYNRPLAEDLTARTGVPAWTENDANCAALAEYSSRPTSTRDPFVLFTLGTGIGGGIIVDGSLVEGAHGAGSEIGHLLVRNNGRACECGSYGCLEKYASGRALMGRYLELRVAEAEDRADPSPVTVSAVGLPGPLEEEFADALGRGDPSAKTAVRETSEALAVGIAQVVRMIDPAVIVIGGGVSALGDPLLTAIRQAVDEYPAGGSGLFSGVIEPARLGDVAGLVGAAMIAERELSLTSMTYAGPDPQCDLSVAHDQPPHR